MPDSVVIQFELPRDEVVHVLWRRMVLRPQLLWSLAFFLLTALLCFLAGEQFALAGALLVLYVVSRPWVLYRVISRLVQRAVIFQGPKTVEFDAAGVVATGADWQTRYPWRHFQSWSEDPLYFYLYVTDSGVASLVPKRAMDALQQAFLRACLASERASK
jgi:hypothetical protein